MQVPYSGQLAESGELVDGTRSMQFQIVGTGAPSALYDSGTTSVVVSQGAFSVVLGGAGLPSLDSSVFSTVGLKLRVSVEGTPLTPDIELPFAPYAAGGDHSTLQNLGADTHVQYLNLNGVRAMTGNLNLGGQDIVNASGGTFTGTFTVNGTMSFGDEPTDSAAFSGPVSVGGSITAGGPLTLENGEALGNGADGVITMSDGTDSLGLHLSGGTLIQPGRVTGTGDGLGLVLSGGDGNGTNSSGGTVTLQPGSATGTGAAGMVEVLGKLAVTGGNNVCAAFPDGLDGTAKLLSISTSGYTVTSGMTLYVTHAYAPSADTLLAGTVTVCHLAAATPVSFGMPMVIPGGATLSAGTSEVRISGIEVATTVTPIVCNNTFLVPAGKTFAVHTFASPDASNGTIQHGTLGVVAQLPPANNYMADSPIYFPSGSALIISGAITGTVR
ncbi:hypothetical protein HZA57_04790 [Candidatus Poribacteria bacterium]|nr:hypothetical protein [Candidatus Poribacteria bacterium]